MKNLKNLFAVIIFCLAFSTLKSQSTYTITNYTAEHYYVILRIAEHPTVCGSMALSTRDGIATLYPAGCSGEVQYESLSTDE